ncbi:antirestriction protein ArdC [Pedobacter sp. UYEF25]
MMETKKALFELVAERLIDQLKKGTSPFQQPWTEHSSANFNLPYNPTTNKAYRGMNTLWLSMQKMQDPRWLTFKQAEGKNWKVIKGAKGTQINFVKTHDLKKVLDKKGKPVLDHLGKPKKIVVWLSRPVITCAWVFNASQIDGIPTLQQERKDEPSQQWTNIERAEIIVANTNADLRHGGNKAYYVPSRDYIQMPEKHQFDSGAKYYATLLHELGHWTGHADRLNRDLKGTFGTEEYAREELRAEIASLMIGSELNIGHNFGQHAAYVDSWVRILQDDSFEIHKASSDAQKITDKILSFEQKREIEQEIDVKKPETSLLINDVVDYKSASFKVISSFRNRMLSMEDLTTGNRFKLSHDDGLYKSLVQAKQQELRTQHQMEELSNPLQKTNKR